MAKSIKGLAKIDVKEEVAFVTEGLRAKIPSQVQASAAHLKTGLADVVGCHLLPFVSTLGGELVMCCKRLNLPEVWEAAAALALAVGAASAKSLCEPLLDHLSHMRELSSEAIQAARTFIAVCGRHVVSPIRTAVEYAALRELYHTVVHASRESTIVDDVIDLLATSLTAPYLFNSNPILPHAVYALRRAAASSKLTIYTRTTALSVLRCLDAQVHTQAAPLVVPKLDEIETQLKHLQGLDADAELAFFSAVPSEPVEQAQPTAQSLSTSAPTFEAPAPISAPAPAGTETATPPPIFKPAELLLPETSSEGFFSPVSTIGGSPLETFGRKRSASPGEEPAAKRLETVTAPSLSLLPVVAFDSQVTAVSSVDAQEAQTGGTRPDADIEAAVPEEEAQAEVEVEEEEKGSEGEGDEGDSMSSISASVDLPDVDL